MQLRSLLFIPLLFFCLHAFGQQQDVDFHLNAHLLTGQKILKVKRDFHDIYLWVLGQNNTVYRVNSNTLAVDDYSANFTAYNNLQFVDIMGHSADTVFIATNSTNVIEWANGNFKVIGTADGIPGIVNSVGIDLGWNINSGATLGEMIIGTNVGMRTFNVQTQTVGLLPDSSPLQGNSSIADSRVYESTYRTETFKDSSIFDLSGWSSDTLLYLPVAFNTTNIDNIDGPFVVDYVWMGDQTFGNHVNTVLGLNEASDYNTTGYFANYFWGTEKGMFQNGSNFSSRIIQDQWWSYLNGIKVNKITNIMGLTAFSKYYDEPLIKQNLLIGTDTGFYFSNSIYNYEGGSPGQPTLFHDDELGSTVINDICVNAVPDARPICENGVWLAAADGLYLLKPDYGAYISNKQQKLINFSNQPDTLSQINVCTSTPLSASVNSSYTNVQWYKDGAELPAQSKDTLIITGAGNYNAVIYDPCEAIHIESNHLQVSITPGPVFTFNYPDTIKQCNNNPDTLQTTYNPGYHYQWYSNDLLNGDTSSLFVVTHTGRYKVEVSACTNSWVPSKEVQVNMITLPAPQITAEKAIYCAEDTAILTVNVPIDSSYNINWYLNGSLMTGNTNLTSIKNTTAGNYTVSVNSNISGCAETSAAFQLVFTSSPVFTFNYPYRMQFCSGTPVTLSVTGNPAYRYRWYTNDVLNGDSTPVFSGGKTAKYKVEVSACPGSWVASKEVQVNFIQLPVPAILPNKPAFCIGDNATLNLVLPADTSFTINWYRDSVLLSNNTNQRYIITNIPGNYTVTIVNNTVNTDGTTCTQTSAVQPIIFNPPPVIAIEKIVKTTLCAGQTVYLQANYPAGAVKWSTGETTDQIAVTTTGNYTATVTTAAGCQADTSITVTFLPTPVFHINDTTICTYKNQPVTLTAPPGYADYEWNGQPGSQTYQVSQPQTVSLTVTDTSGCQATQPIVITDQCPNIFIPNTFTPNGDGINDTWKIEGLDNDPTVMVKVFTRYGGAVFQSKGYGTPWDGVYSGKKLPAGVYYYIVTAKNGSQKFSGPVTIIY